MEARITESSEGIIAASCSGRFNSAEFAELLTRVPGAVGCSLLLEMQDVDFRVPSSAMRCAAWTISSDDQRLPAKVAFVADDRLAFGMLRIFTSLVERTSEDFNVFVDRLSAVQWMSEEPACEIASLRASFGSGGYSCGPCSASRIARYMATASHER